MHANQTTNRLLCIVSWCLVMACNQSAQHAPAVQRKQAYQNRLIVIQPFDNFSPDVLHFIQDSIRNYYPVRVQVNEVSALPAAAFYKPRNRYKADSIIHWLAQRKPASAITMVGFTTQDISTTKGNNSDFGIMGLGYQPGTACVVSTFRLKKDSPTNALLKLRLLKTIAHEIGHNLGLPHCANMHCLMADAKGKLNQDNEQGFCTECLKKLPF